MSLHALSRLTLTLAVAAALAACGKTGTPADAAQAAADPATRFDLSKVDAPVAAFAVADLDPAVSACADLNGHVNGKWLAANPETTV